MKTFFGALALFVLFAGLSLAQGVNNVTVSGGGFTVTAAVGDARCIFTGPHVIDSGTIDCYGGKTLLLHTLWHAFVGAAYTGSIKFPLHKIAWTLTHLTPGSTNMSFEWSISVDGGPAQTGTF